MRSILYLGKHTIDRNYNREKITSNEILFAQHLTRGVSPEDAYIKSFRTKSYKYAKIHAGILVKSERIRKVMKEELKPVLVALGIEPELVLKGIRDQEDRLRFLGYRVENYKLCAFVVSAILAGIAGALYVPQVGIINPGEFAPLKSIEVVVWVALGGRGTLFGAILGGVIVNLAKSYFTVNFPEIWLYFLGGLFVLVTIFLPNGLVGVIKKIFVFIKNKKEKSF